MTQSPVDTVRRLVAAINAGNLDAAVALYEPSGVLLSPEGAPARGTAELRAALGGFIAMKPRLESQAERVFESGDLALYLSRWREADRARRGIHRRAAAPGGRELAHRDRQSLGSEDAAARVGRLTGLLGLAYRRLG